MSKLAYYSLKRDGNKKLSEHFTVREFRCKDGSDAIILNPELVTVLERLYDRLGARAINITSGYRTPEHSEKVGGYCTDQHTQGNAADIKVKKNATQYFSGKEICCALEDLNHQGGVGYINNTSVHLDVRGRKVWFDETNSERTTSSFYGYWGIKRKYTVIDPKLNVRKGPGTNYAIVDSLSAGTAVTVSETSGTWGKIGTNQWISIKPAYVRRV